jgi:hypothetical protein
MSLDDAHHLQAWGKVYCFGDEQKKFKKKFKKTGSMFMFNKSLTHDEGQNKHEQDAMQHTRKTA